jgi:hypothetical protein
MVQTLFCQGTIYTARSAFESALNSSTTITFEDLPVTPEVGTGLSSVTTSGVTFDAGMLLFIRDKFAPVPASGNYLRHFDGSIPVSIFLPSGITAFGADFSAETGANPTFNGTLTANLVGGQSFTYGLGGPGGSWTFFGVTFQQPIASLIFDDRPSAPLFLHNEILDNVTFGTIPEPSAVGLLTLGGLLFALRTWAVRPGCRS